MFLVPVSRSIHPLSRLFDERLFAQRSPSLDVAETEQGYDVSIDLPGVAKQDVKITIEGRQVRVSTERQRDESQADPKDGARVIYRERSSSSFARSFVLPEELDQDASQARLENGVLTLSLAKKRTAAVKPLTIN